MSTGTGQHIGGGTVIRTGDGDTRRSPGGGPAFVPADENWPWCATPEVPRSVS